MAGKYQSVGGTDVADTHEKTHPSVHAGFISKVFYLWANKLMEKANMAALTSHDLWRLPPMSNAKAVAAKFDPSFRQTRSIVTSYLSIFGWRFIFIGLLQVLIAAGTLYGPVVLQLVMELVESKTFDTQLALLYVASLFGVKITQALISTHTTFQCEVIALRFTSALQQLVFQKALVLDAKSRRAKAADVTQLFTSEIMWIVSFSYYTHQIWIIPCQLGVVLYLLYNVIGYAAFVGAGIIVVTLVLNNGLAHIQRSIWRVLMQQKERRMKLMQNVFGAIVDQKLESFADRQDLLPDIQAHRATEMKTLWGAFSLSACVTAILYSAPILVTTASLAFYTLVMKESITATKVFTALALFRSLRAPLIGLPQITAHLMQALVALGRLRDFLNMTEKDPNIILTHHQLSANQYENFANNAIDIAIEEGSFGWDADKPMFRGLNLLVKRGELVVVHGEDQAGKSSLCNVLLGELEKYEGSIFVGGRIAYCSEDPWIQRMTIRENILFGKPYDRKKYSLVMEACGLRPSEDGFAFGDRMEVLPSTPLTLDDKIRISLARACYNDADIYVLDIAVPETVFTKCILGLLCNKTIILVSENEAIIQSKFIDKSFDVGEGIVAENSRKRFWEEEPHILEQEVPDYQMPMFDALISPSIRSPFGMLTEEPSFHMDEMTGNPDDDGGDMSRVAFAGYFRAAGWCLVTFLLVVQCMWQSLQIISDLWLSHWCTTASLGLSSNSTLLMNNTMILDTIVLTKVEVVAYSKWNMEVYAVFALCSTIMVIFRTLITSCAGIRASQTLFDSMTKSLFEAPLTAITADPIGRILNVFSGDINTIDTRLPFSFGGFLANLFIAVFCLGTCMVCLRYYGLVILLWIGLYAYFGMYYAQPAREIEQLTRITRAPHLQFVGEAIEGAVIIRAFGMKQIRRFHRMHQHHVNVHQEASYTQEVFTQWFALRMQLLHAGLIASITVALVCSRSLLTPGLFGLVFNYALQVPPHLEFIFSIWSSVLSSMVGVQRVLSYIQWGKKIEV
ncbi:Aste57867_7879 [Aphanomyces stellatus]|uniref:Aste57867_7879 protein n=1 Tax=Aphanomyces stellatus TaxID=120398 RepID=A0A485KIV3_9STRA|nr:hypothetical protein As57867_007849 [Aphanomyces stellatus]VFT84772.1 Aste57867_7879 [Aphanomyces stellatus]